MRLLRILREINAASFPIVVVFAIAFALVSLFARSWVSAIFGVTARWIWAVLAASIAAEVFMRIPIAVRRIQWDWHRVPRISVSFGDHSDAKAALRKFWAYTILVASRGRGIIVSAALRTRAIATELHRGAIAVFRLARTRAPSILPFALIILLAQFSPSLPEPFRLPVQFLFAFLVICVVIAAMGAVGIGTRRLGPKNPPPCAIGLTPGRFGDDHD